jgi:hypothetical protein
MARIEAMKVMDSGTEQTDMRVFAALRGLRADFTRAAKGSSHSSASKRRRLSATTGESSKSTSGSQQRAKDSLICH